MRLKGAPTCRLGAATKVLSKEAKTLRMTFEELLVFIERNPTALNRSTVDAWIVVKEAA
tara:strand:+ start:512 stop:688 length:177 start_codon:yes stop_codon:yes gene_type:complete